MVPVVVKVAALPAKVTLLNAIDKGVIDCVAVNLTVPLLALKVGVPDTERPPVKLRLPEVEVNEPAEMSRFPVTLTVELPKLTVAPLAVRVLLKFSVPVVELREPLEAVTAPVMVVVPPPVL
jgi:hypothetical protein